ncbi:unnamed protein product [Moneuplotes crassus]|uniref:Uncharacterized protein n=1 Tax=Euplotes crassus TaxID=5936 RepID=A0AAD1U9I7_EUPCR|nr:unnamed protein product [Moneuplotes crassus]
MTSPQIDLELAPFWSSPPSSPNQAPSTGPDPIPDPDNVLDYSINNPFKYSVSQADETETEYSIPEENKRQIVQKIKSTRVANLISKLPQNPVRSKNREEKKRDTQNCSVRYLDPEPYGLTNQARSTRYADTLNSNSKFFQTSLSNKENRNLSQSSSTQSLKMKCDNNANFSFEFHTQGNEDEVYNLNVTRTKKEGNKVTLNIKMQEESTNALLINKTYNPSYFSPQTTKHSFKAPSQNLSKFLPQRPSTSLNHPHSRNSQPSFLLKSSTSNISTRPFHRKYTQKSLLKQLQNQHKRKQAGQYLSRVFR